jgi:hypothetical protein
MDQELCRLVAWGLLAACGAGLSAVSSTWILFRQTRYLRAALAREQASNIERQNSLVRTLAEAFSRGPGTTLEDLLEATERDFELKSSKKR